MSHTVTINMIADQEIEVQGKSVNIHDILTIMVDGKGLITDAYIGEEGGNQWQSQLRKTQIWRN